MEKEIIDAFRSSDVKIVETKFNDYDIYLRGTDIKIAIVSVERGIICVAVDGENYQFPVSKLDNAVQLVKDLVDSNKYTKNESISFREAKRILNENGFKLLRESTMEKTIDDTMYSSKLKLLTRKLNSLGIKVSKTVIVKNESRNDNSAEYNLGVAKDGDIYTINVNIYEGKHTTFLLYDWSSNKFIGHLGEGSSFASALSLIDEDTLDLFNKV